MHLLDDCPFSTTLWDHSVALFLRSARIKQNPVGTLLHWPKNPFQIQILNRIWENFPNFLMWSIWNERNTRIFHSKTSYLFNVWQCLRSNLKETISLTNWDIKYFELTRMERQILADQDLDICVASIQPNQKSHSFNPSPDCWNPPPNGFLKLNFDGASKGNPRKVGYGFILRNNRG